MKYLIYGQIDTASCKIGIVNEKKKNLGEKSKTIQK